MSDTLALMPRDEQELRKEAVTWYVLLCSGDATDDDRRAWQRWHASHPDHQRAWQRGAGEPSGTVNVVRKRPTAAFQASPA